MQDGHGDKIGQGKVRRRRFQEPGTLVLTTTEEGKAALRGDFGRVHRLLDLIPKKYLSQLEVLGMLAKEKVGKEFIWLNTD